MRTDSLARVPALGEVLAKLAHAISTEEMRQLNYEVDANKRSQADVVREWLKKKGFLNSSGTYRAKGSLRAIYRNDTA